MQDLKTILEDIGSLDNRIMRLSVEIDKIPSSQSIKEKEKDILNSVDELNRLQENIRLLFNNIYKKSDAERDEKTIAKLKETALRMENGNI